METKIYIKEVKYLFECIKSTTSYENAEKVVKEPKRPIIKKNLVKFSSAAEMSLTETIKWSSLSIIFFPQEFIFNVCKKLFDLRNKLRSSQINT